MNIINKTLFLSSIITVNAFAGKFTLVNNTDYEVVIKNIPVVCSYNQNENTWATDSKSPKEFDFLFKNTKTTVDLNSSLDNCYFGRKSVGSNVTFQFGTNVDNKGEELQTYTLAPNASSFSPQTYNKDCKMGCKNFRLSFQASKPMEGYNNKYGYTDHYNYFYEVTLTVDDLDKNN